MSHFKIQNLSIFKMYKHSQNLFISLVLSRQADLHCKNNFIWSLPTQTYDIDILLIKVMSR